MEKQRSAKRQPKLATCEHCKTRFYLNNTQKWREAKGLASVFFCGRSCAGKWRCKQPGAKFFERVKLVPDVQRRAAGQFEVVRPTVQSWPQVLKVPKDGDKMEAFLATLGYGWFPRFKLATAMRENSGYASRYLVDIANPAMRIAIDVVDIGQDRDLRRDDCLRSSGWTLLRFTKQEIEGNLNFCVKMVWTAISRLAAA